jgi:hypothetical protein
MTEAGKKTDGGNTSVPHEGDHDRVAMLSLRADGTPDQHNPELLGDRDTALRAARRQFAEQAVSAVDAQAAATNPTRATIVGRRGDKPDEVVPLTTDAVRDEPEPAVQTHRAAAAAGEKAAEATVDALLPEKK